MPVTFEVDRMRRIVRTEASGLVTYDDLARHLTEEARDDALGFAEVIDGRGAATDITPQQVRALVARTDALLRQGRLGAVAIVTDSDFAFGMARMYQILAEPLPVQIGVFRTIDEATARLGAAAILRPTSDTAARPLV